MTTIKDVAKQARVSITSASYALNNTGTISEETRKRVLKAAEELNYHPNAFARNLKKRKTRTIGVFIQSFGGSFWEEILEGIHSTVLKTEYELLVCPDTRTVRKILTYRQVDGAIVFDNKVRSDTLLKLASQIFPIIVMDRDLKGDHLCSLLIDNQQGTKEAFYHLYNQGARRIAFISGPADSFDNRERKKIFLIEGDKNNLVIPCYDGNFTESSGYEVATAIIRNNELPEAVFCANDQMAIGFIRAMNENHIKVPDDVAVVGFDDIQLATYVRPSLSTVGASRFLWGSLAAAQLIDCLENDASLQPGRIPTRLVPRESSMRLHVL
jgi:LacI family transcriptional regulator